MYLIKYLAAIAMSSVHSISLVQYLSLSWINIIFIVR